MINELSSIVVEQTNCPKCPSSDAYTIYEDGHCKCYSCGYFLSGSRVIKQNIIKEKNDVCLPLDCNTDLPASTLLWLNKFNITLKEARDNKFKWSPSKELLIFPVYGHDSTLLFWQGRYFGKDKKSKYISRGKSQDLLHIINPSISEEIILVEDLLSAIKIGRQNAAIPIWGSHISINTFKRLFLQFKSVGVWLDSDKMKEAVKYASIGSQLGSTRVLYTQLDPKCYSDEQIQEILK